MGPSEDETNLLEIRTVPGTWFTYSIRRLISICITSGVWPLDQLFLGWLSASTGLSGLPASRCFPSHPHPYSHSALRACTLFKVGWGLDQGRADSARVLWPPMGQRGACAPGFLEPGRATIYNTGSSAGLFQAPRIPGGEQAPSCEGASQPSTHPLSKVFSEPGQLVLHESSQTEAQRGKGLAQGHTVRSR